MVTRRIGSGSFTPTPVVVGTMILLFVIYLFTGFAANFAPSIGVVYDYSYLSAPDVLHGEVWRLASYGLLHDLERPFHLILNLLVLFFFARDLEMRFGKLKTAVFFLVAVVVGGIFVTVAYLLGISRGAAIGFSAAVEASVVAWALFNRNAPVLLFFAIPMRGIHMLVLALVFWLLDAVSMSGNSAAAHLGGIATGAVVWALSTKRNRLRLFWDDVLHKLRIRKQPKLTVVPPKDRWVN